MRGSPEVIVGKRISAVVLKEARDYGSSPAMQLSLMFDDGTYYEFYTSSSAISCAGGLDRSGMAEVLHYMAERNKVIFCAADDPDAPLPHPGA